MSDSTETAETPTQDNSAIKEMREAMKRKDDENRELRAVVVDTHLQALNLESGKGLGKAIAAGYDGELTAEAVAEYAKSEYEYEVTPDNTQANKMEAAQNRQDSFAGSSGSMQPTSGEDVVAAFDQRLAQPDATRKEAMQSIEAKLQHYVAQNL